MFKSKVLTALTFFIAMNAGVLTLTLAHTASAAEADDVFMDEGDGDFDAAPPTAPTPAKSVEVEKAPTPRPAAPATEPEEMPMLTDESAAPVEASPVEDITAPAVTEPKEKKAKKKKSSSKTAKASSRTAKPVAARGSFAVTKEECPMMRTPASTGETMLTVKASKKIWVEDAGDGWVKGFNKAGEPGYISKDCFQ